MTMERFIRENRKELDTYILGRVPGARMSDGERRSWVENDETLYRWAKVYGVKL